MNNQDSIFRDAYDVLLSGVNKPFHAVVYYPEEGEIEHAGIYIVGGNIFRIDHISNFGNNKTDYSVEEYGKFVVLKNDAYPYWEAPFLDENRYYTVFFPETGKVKMAKVTNIFEEREDRFFFIVIDEDGNEEKFSRSEYEAKFIVMKD
ncbi:MAG: hypothetical protein IJ867_05675 [Clostridia bacterium]|nr:hypothetical protein [Clostridia bacterium]